MPRPLHGPFVALAARSESISVIRAGPVRS